MHAFFKYFCYLCLNVLCIRSDLSEFLLDLIDLFVNQGLFVLQSHIIILGLVKCIIVSYLNIDQVVILAIILSKPSENAISTESVLAAVAVVLISSSGMFRAKIKVLSPRIDVHSPMIRHDL